MTTERYTLRAAAYLLLVKDGKYYCFVGPTLAGGMVSIRSQQATLMETKQSEPNFVAKQWKKLVFLLSQQICNLHTLCTSVTITNI